MSSPVNENSNGTAPSVQKIVLTAPDGLRIAGSFYESSLPNSPAVLLLHQWQSDRHSYDEFAGRMQKKGFNVLTIDGRGFGESTATDDGRTVAPERTDAAVKGMLGDVGTAFEFLSKQKNVDPAKVGIIGASYGSSLALIYSADNPQVAAVALLSPGLNYFGNMATEPAIKKFGDRPLYMIAAADDKESADAVGKLMAVGNNPRYGEKIYPHGGHGTALFNVVAAPQNNGQPQLAETLETFFIERFGFGKK
jgi:pimeloyl-ACP methyl ester carboxylesterase